jgi:hypothetical protein
MSLIFDERAALGAQPACHAFIVGVSAYPHLPSGGSAMPAMPLQFGLTQLSSAALSARNIYDWRARAYRQSSRTRPRIWIITINSLRQRLEAFIDNGNREAGAAQSRQGAVHRRQHAAASVGAAAPVKVWLTVDPDAAVGVAAVSVVDLEDTVVEDLKLRDDGTLYVVTAPAGGMIVRALTESEREGWRPRVKKLLTIEPPYSPYHLSLTRPT